MGITTSHAAPSTPPPPPPPPAVGSLPTVISPTGLQQLLPLKESETPAEKTDYLHLPCPIKYEEIQREAYSELLFSVIFIANQGFSCLFVAKFVSADLLPSSQLNNEDATPYG